MKNQWIKYSIILGVIILFYFSSYYFNNYLLKINRELTGNFILKLQFLTILQFIFHALFGVFIGAEKFYMELRIEGEWSIDIPRFLCISIPTLIFSLSIILYFFHGITILEYIARRVTKNSLILFQVLFGYSIITSFYKKDNSKSKDRGEKSLRKRRR